MEFWQPQWKSELFEFAGDAWDWLYENGFVQSLSDHREFAHPDGRRARVLLPEGEEQDQETEIKLYPAPGGRACGM